MTVQNEDDILPLSRLLVWPRDRVPGSGTELALAAAPRYFFFKTAGTQLLPLSSCCYLKRRCDDDLLGPFKWKRSIECSYIWIAFPLLSKLSWAYLWKCISGFSILFHWSMYLSLQIPCCINYCIEIVSFKVKESDFPPLHSSFSRFKISLRNRFYLITWNAHTYTHK